MANGRLGFKCIPPYTSCEIYQNSSGSQASISIGAQGLNASVNNTISVAAGTTAYCLVCSQNEATGTNCFKDTSAITVAGAAQTDPHGAWIQTSTAIGGTVSTRPTSFMNVDGTRTSIAGTALRAPAQYGGSEYVLPGEGMFNNCTDFIGGTCKAIHRDYFMTMDCHGRSPLLIGSQNFCCCCEFAAAMFINPQCDCAGAAFGYGVGQNSCCSICFQSLQCLTITERHIIAVNHYAAPMYVETSGTISYGGAGTLQLCCDNTGCSCCKFKLQSPILGFYTGCCETAGQGAEFCGVNYLFVGCCCTATGCYFRTGLCSQCCCISGNPQRPASAVSLCHGQMACSQHCCNMDTTNLMSPYGVARAATFGESLFAIRTCGGRTKYFSAFPGCCFANAINPCSCVNYEIFNINIPNDCEYPVKYLAYNPKEDVKKTYFMVRSSLSNNCGIFEYKFADFNGPGHCTGTCVCNGEGTANQNATFVRNVITDSPYVEKVADFPSVMTASKYTNPLMCVGCLYRMAPKGNPFWSITVYNHDTSEWDRFTTNDLITWKSVAPDFRWDVSSTFSYLTFDDCLRTSCNNFENAVPKCGYFDFDVSANNYERTGVVISDGESIIVNNNTTESLTAQVWGYEG